MLLAGIRRTHAIAHAAQSIPQQWGELRGLGLRDVRGQRAYGAYCSSNSKEFEYLTGVEVDSFEGLPADLGRIRVPAQTYAVFTHEGHVSETGATWQHIWQSWLPSSDYEDAETPPFELYDQRFNPNTGTGGFEIWFPIREKQQR